MTLAAAKLFDVQGLATIITGGASGIGLACAEVMAANGARVALFDRDSAALESAVRALSAASAEARAETVDVTDRVALERAFEGTAGAFGRIDVVFANAGIGGGAGFLAGDGVRNPQRMIENIPHAQWEHVIAVNLSGLFWTIQAAVRRMKTHGAGRIIVTSSVSSFKTERHVGTPYVVSKAGVAHLVRQAALELARFGITVNAIAPGPFITNISAGRLQDPAARGPFERAIPMHRLGRADDVQGLALFLASPAAKYITGAQLNVDGGFSLGDAD